MPKFNYQARTEEGQTKAGVVEASDRESAFKVLKEYGYYVTNLERVGEKPLLSRKISLFEGVSLKDIVNFTRQLAIMFRSEVPLVDALRALAVQWQDPDFKQTIMEVSEDVEGGSNLSDALSHYPETFSRFYIAMVKAGEASGNLSNSLNYLADYLERKNDLNSKIKGAALYPAFVVGVIIAILSLMIFFVFPRLEQVLERSAAELPWMTKMTLSSASFLRQWGWLILLMIAFVVTVTLHYFRRTEEGRKKWDQISLQLPLIGTFLRKIYLSRFARNLSTLIQGGLPIAQALEITGRVVGNNAYQKVIMNTRNKVRRGEAISTVLSQHPDLIPPLVVQMVSVGEKTGTLDSTLMHVVDFYEKEVERFSENLLNLLEPILIIILGVIVGGIVLTVFMPLYQLRMGGL